MEEKPLEESRLSRISSIWPTNEHYYDYDSGSITRLWTDTFTFLKM